MNAVLVQELGLRLRPSFLSDRWFYAALLAAPLIVALPLLPPLRAGLGLSAVLSFVLWAPLVEELLFRGVIQGQLVRQAWARRRLYGISVANAITSILFGIAHLWRHSFWWSAAVLLPSLVFGLFRERHGQLYSAMILHAAYNACYLAAAMRAA